MLIVIVFLLLYFTLAYPVVLFLLVTFILIISIALSKDPLSAKKNKAFGCYSKKTIEFSLTEQGQCQFLHQPCYQLLPTSRISFFGCWLKMSNADEQQKNYFLYRDSVSQQDFSRLARVVSNLS